MLVYGIAYTYIMKLGKRIGIKEPYIELLGRLIVLFEVILGAVMWRGSSG